MHAEPRDVPPHSASHAELKTASHRVRRESRSFFHATSLTLVSHETPEQASIAPGEQEIKEPRAPPIPRRCHARTRARQARPRAACRAARRSPRASRWRQIRNRAARRAARARAAPSRAAPPRRARASGSAPRRAASSQTRPSGGPRPSRASQLPGVARVRRRDDGERHSTRFLACSWRVLLVHPSRKQCAADRTRALLFVLVHKNKSATETRADGRRQRKRRGSFEAHKPPSMPTRRQRDDNDGDDGDGDDDDDAPEVDETERSRRYVSCSTPMKSC